MTTTDNVISYKEWKCKDGFQSHKDVGDTYIYVSHFLFFVCFLVTLLACRNISIPVSCRSTLKKNLYHCLKI